MVFDFYFTVEHIKKMKRIETNELKIKIANMNRNENKDISSGKFDVSQHMWMCARKFNAAGQHVNGDSECAELQLCFFFFGRNIKPSKKVETQKTIYKIQIVKLTKRNVAETKSF